MKFDLTITMTLVVQTIAMVGGLVIAVRRHLRHFEGRIDFIEKEQARLHTENVVRLIVLESRVGDLWERFIHPKNNHTQ